MKNLGLVYKRNNQAYIGIFENQTINEFRTIEDPDSLYDNLELTQFMLVNLVDEFDLPDMGLIAVQTIGPITMLGLNKKPVDVVEFLEEAFKWEEDDYQSFMQEFHENLCIG